MEKYGLIGYPLRHSFSIGYFNEKFKSEGINAEYVNFEIPSINNFMEVIEENPNLCGLNVTIPYKEQVIPFLDELDRDTAKIGAVNVIKIIRQQKGKVKLVGYNSDIIGFTQSIQPLLQPHHQKALILGTGGASKAVYHGLKNLGIESIFVSRTHKADDMLTYEELTPKKIQALVRTNLEIPLLLTNRLLRVLKKNHGYIINISSVTAKQSSPHGCAYAATKAGLSSFGKSLFEEARKYGVKVTTIHPDMTDTNLYRDADFTCGEEPESYLLPDEVVKAVAYVLDQREGMVVPEITLRPQLHRIARK